MTLPRFKNVGTGALLTLLPWLILLVTLGVTWLAWDHEHQTTRRALRSQFDFSLREAVSGIEQRVTGYEQMLRGVQALFATTPLDNRAALDAYVTELQLDANFAGVQELGVLRANVAADPVRRGALEKARDSGMASISGKVYLKDDPATAQPGFVMYLPIYTQGRSHDSVAQRRADLTGWVYATFHMNDFMASLYGTQSAGLTLAMYDGTDTSEAALLYRAGGDAAQPEAARAGALAAKEYVVVAGHNWTLALSTQEPFEARYGRGTETLTAVAGTVLSVLLAMLAWLMVNGRARALQLAESMTRELRHMAQHDPLTDLPNRALFDDRLNQELARAKRQQGRFALVFIDLDYFKPINDTFGHEVGDKVLQQVARRLQDVVRAVDTVGRLGGDEFVVLMTQLSSTDTVLALAEKLQQALRPSLQVRGHTLSVSCSIGIAAYPENGEDALALTRNADDAMYLAKEAGRNCVRQCNTQAPLSVQ